MRTLPLNNQCLRPKNTITYVCVPSVVYLAYQTELQLASGESKSVGTENAHLFIDIDFFIVQYQFKRTKIYY